MNIEREQSDIEHVPTGTDGEELTGAVEPIAVEPEVVARKGMIRKPTTRRPSVTSFSLNNAAEVLSPEEYARRNAALERLSRQQRIMIQRIPDTPIG